MNRFLAAALCACIAAPALAGGDPVFEDHFLAKSLRIDLFHTGNARVEYYAVDELVEEPHWAGNHRALIDTTNRGERLVRVFDLETNGMIYSRGFSTVFGEWITTDEAGTDRVRTFHESIIVPFPKRPVQVRIDRRDRSNVFRNVYDLVVDPGDFHIRREGRYRYFRVRTLEENGPTGAKVDFVLIGDGYRKDQLHKLRGDAKKYIDRLFDMEPFRGRRSDFNVRLIEAESEDSGVDDPRRGTYRHNICGLSFNSLELDRYMLTLENKVVRDIAGNAPYDLIIMLANEEKYGGGGIFNLYATCVSDNEYSEYVFIHELGHAFGGLGDEYYASTVTYNDAYPRGVEPWEPNITALLDPDGLKWGDLVAEGIPVPTPDDSTFADAVGCFEGAGYSAEGLYRAARDCMMFSKSMVGFCPVCRRALERMIDFHTK